MPTLRITERKDPEIRYEVVHDDGRVEHGHIADASQYIGEARVKKVSLASVLAQVIDLPDIKPVEEVVRVTPPADVSVGGDGEIVERQPEVQYVLPEHDHPDYLIRMPAHEHEHEHPLSPHDHNHDHPLKEHEHELPPHGHGAILQRLEALERAVENLSVPHEHPHNHAKELQAYGERLQGLGEQLQRGLTNLESHAHPEYLREMPVHEHPVLAHHHPPTDHDHPVKEHSHPEIVGRFSKAEPVETKDASELLHVHRFDTMNDDGKGWRCGICGVPREDVSG